MTADLRKALEAIKQATIDGRVCDDVAWFDTITTLHDFCDQVLAADTQSRPVTAGRDEIARIIEDNIYRKHNGNWDGDYADLLVAADEILALGVAVSPQDRAPDNLTDALIRVIDGWRATHPDLTYFETVTVIEGIGRTLHNLRADATLSRAERGVE